MKLEPSLEEFREILQTKKYLFHFHTTYTDGKLTVEDYFAWAKNNNIEILIFCEHVRRKLNYSFKDFEMEIELNSKKYGIPYILGVETKLLPGGELDINLDILQKVNLVGWGCHSFPKNLKLYQESIGELLFNIKHINKIFVWVHPGRFLIRNFKKINLHKFLNSFIDMFIEKNCFIEKNLRENLPPDEIISSLLRKNNNWVIYGVDAHSKEDLKRYENYMDN